MFSPVPIDVKCLFSWRFEEIGTAKQRRWYTVGPHSSYSLKLLALVLVKKLRRDKLIPRHSLGPAPLELEQQGTGTPGDPIIVD